MKIQNKKSPEYLAKKLNEIKHDIEMEQGFIDALTQKAAELDPNKLYLLYIQGKLTEEQHTRFNEHRSKILHEIKTKKKRLKKLQAKKEKDEKRIEQSAPSSLKFRKQKRKTLFFAFTSLLLLLTTAALGYQCYALTKTNQTISSEKDELSSLYNTEKNKAERYWSDYMRLQNKYSSVSKEYEELDNSCDLVYSTYHNEINNALSRESYVSIYVSETLHKGEIFGSRAFIKLAEDIKNGAASALAINPATSKNSIPNQKIKIAGSKQSVVDACGSPDKMVNLDSVFPSAIWYYGTSWIEFDINGKVRAWYIGDTELPVE